MQLQRLLKILFYLMLKVRNVVFVSCLGHLWRVKLCTKYKKHWKSYVRFLMFLFCAGCTENFCNLVKYSCFEIKMFTFSWAKKVQDQRVSVHFHVLIVGQKMFPIILITNLWWRSLRQETEMALEEQCLGLLHIKLRLMLLVGHPIKRRCLMPSNCHERNLCV